jgi:DNA-directed RNA polymerase subunit RPC12/RpoP
MKIYYERRDERGAVIERVGPFASEESAAAHNARQHQVHIADAHNRVRPPGSSGGGGRQLVHSVKVEDGEDWPRDENGLRLNPDLFLERTEDEPLLQHYRMLHDGLSDMIEDCRLAPDGYVSQADYQWLVRMLENASVIAAREAGEEPDKHMVCRKCGEDYWYSIIEDADEACPACGSRVVDEVK